ncbi:hypothetical protein [Nostoc sp. PCC 7107]|uniref:hypothetical protein n=1 Tax=Nostoc sp. PCC 7107 TaxID=317936 RepID=UPI00029EEC0C|nr:hypothetical protein [Nostoc sp. PCC 7107]AFY44539.1 hypothetical protein Nos7107_3986 [Nostoc sp. PCC 7107]
MNVFVVVTTACLFVAIAYIVVNTALTKLMNVFVVVTTAYLFVANAYVVVTTA